jgi:hypothetical protein
MLSLALLLVACDHDENVFPTPTPGSTPQSDGEDLAVSKPESSEEDDDSTTSVVGATTTRRSAPAPADGDCSEDDGGTSVSTAPINYGVQLKRLTLLGADGTEDHDLLLVDALSDSSEVLLTSEPSEMDGEIIRPPAGTYDGIELEVFSTRADIEMTLLNLDTADMPVRGWFVENGDIAPRDITVEIDGIEHWVAMTDMEAVVAQTAADVEEAAESEGDTGFEVELGLDPGEDPPADRLTMWEDETFWSAEPIVLSSADGTKDYRLGIEGGSATIEDDTDLTVALWFDIGAVLSWWEGGTVDGTFSLENDCGLRVGPPDVTVSIEQD